MRDFFNAITLLANDKPAHPCIICLIIHTQTVETAIKTNANFTNQKFTLLVARSAIENKTLQRDRFLVSKKLQDP